MKIQCGDKSRQILCFTIPVLLVVAVAWGAWFLFVPRESPAPGRALAKAGQETAAPLASAQLNAQDTSNILISNTLAANTLDPDWSVIKRERIAEGLQTVVGFFAARSSGDPEDYIAWSEQQKLQPVQDFPTKPPVPSDVDWAYWYRFRTGVAPPCR